MVRSASQVLLGLVLLASLVPAAQATHGTCAPEACLPIVPVPAVPYFSGAVDFEAMDVRVTVEDGLARTDLAITLDNSAADARQATLAIPMPSGAVLVGFNLSWTGHHLEGVVLERGQAIATYNEAREQGLDAALLEEAGRQLVRLRVNVGPGEQRVLAASYVEPVDLAHGSRVYRMPLGLLDRMPEVLTVDVAVRSHLGVIDLRAPFLDVPLSQGAGHLRLLNPTALEDLVLVWREEGAQRSFLVAASDPTGGPTQYWGSICIEGAPIARDVVFVLDQSGSMAGLKIEEARQALAAALETVGPQDRYGVVLFSDTAAPFSPALVAGTSSQVAADTQKVLGVKTVAGTNIDAGLREAFRLLTPESSRLPMVVFLTDGLPTVGVTDHQQIIANAKAANTRHAAIHVVPIGLDADYTFLADLALGSGGAFVDLGAPDERLSDHLARLTDVLSQPVVRDPVLTVQGLGGLEVYPKRLPAIFTDGCLDVRLSGTATGPIDVWMDGFGADGLVHTQATFALADIPVEPAVRSLWGQARVADLLAQERAQPSAALRRTIVSEAVAYSQLSPYTAWVLADTGPQPPQQGSSGTVAATSSATGTVTGGASRTYGNVPAGGDGDGDGDADYGSGDAETPGLDVAALLGALALAALAVRRRR